MGRPTYQELKESILNGNLYTQTQCIGHSMGGRCMNAVPLHLVNIARERLKVDVSHINEVDVRDILSCLLCERQTCGQNQREKQLYQRIWSDELRHLDSQRHKQASRYLVDESDQPAFPQRRDSLTHRTRRSVGWHPQTPQRTRSNTLEDARASDKISLDETCVSSSPGSASVNRYSTPSLSETLSTPIDDACDYDVEKELDVPTPYRLSHDRSSSSPEKTAPLIWHSPSVSPMGHDFPTPSHKSSVSTMHYHAISDPQTSPVSRYRASAYEYRSPIPPTPHLKPSKYNLRGQNNTPAANATTNTANPPDNRDSEVVRARNLTNDILCGAGPVPREAGWVTERPSSAQPVKDDRSAHMSLPTPPPPVYPRPMQRYKHFTAPPRASPVMDLDTRITSSPKPQFQFPGAPTPVPILFTVPKSAAPTLLSPPLVRRTQSAPSGAMSADALVKARLEELAAEARARQSDFPRIGQVWPMVASMFRGYTGLVGESIRCFGRSEYRD